jgi:chromosomal replication initiation ATPase DnaA
VLQDLQSVLTRENYSTWFGPTYVVEQVGDLLRVAVPKLFHKEWIESKLGSRVTSSLERLGYGAMRIEYVVTSE